MRMSISTTSGFSRRACVDRLRAVGGLADDVDVVLGVEDHPEAGADERLVVGDQDRGCSCGLLVSACRGMRARTANPPPSRRPADSSPPTARTRSRMPTQPVAARPASAVAPAAPRRGRRSRAPASVAPQRTRTSVVGARRACLMRVRERLLDDAVGGEVDAGRQRRAARPRPTAAPAGPAARARATSAPRRQRRAAGASVACPSPACEHAEQAAHLGQRRAAGVLDPRRGLAARAPGRGRGSRRAPPACTTMTLTEWATTSCISRAIRRRSSATARARRGLARLLGAQRGLVQLLGEPRARAHGAAEQPASPSEARRARRSSPVLGRGRANVDWIEPMPDRARSPGPRARGAPSVYAPAAVDRPARRRRAGRCQRLDRRDAAEVLDDDEHRAATRRRRAGGGGARRRRRTAPTRARAARRPRAVGDDERLDARTATASDDARRRGRCARAARGAASRGAPRPAGGRARAWPPSRCRAGAQLAAVERRRARARRRGRGRRAAPSSTTSTATASGS